MVWKQNGITRDNSKLVAKEGSIISFSNDETGYVQIVIYQSGFPVLIGYGMNGRASLLLQRVGFDLKGESSLDVRAYTKKGSEQVLKGNLTII